MLNGHIAFDHRLICMNISGTQIVQAEDSLKKGRMW